MKQILEKDLCIADLFYGQLQLASPPNIYFDLQKVTEDSTKSLSDAAFIIEKDAALAIKLLKIVNSAFYGFPSKIASVNQAISLIGTKELQNIILSTVVMDKFSNLPSDMLSMCDFWAKSLRCALIAQAIDTHLGKEFSQEVFLCGILHHVGQLVFFLRIPELARDVALTLQGLEQPSDQDEIRTEESVIGFNHFETGAELTRRWKLPTLVSESIALHTDDSTNTTNKQHKLAAIIRLADFYSNPSSSYAPSAPDNFNIPENEINTLINNSEEKFADIFKVFYPN